MVWASAVFTSSSIASYSSWSIPLAVSDSGTAQRVLGLGMVSSTRAGPNTANESNVQPHPLSKLLYWITLNANGSKTSPVVGSICCGAW